MSSSDVSSVTNYFSTAAEGFTTTLGSTITAGATSVPLNATSGLTNGKIFVGVIEPGATAQQTFTGTVDVSGSQITNVVWVRGTNVGHATGVTIVDYVSGAHHNMTTTGILKQHTQTGAHTALTNTGGLTTDTLAATGNATVGGTLGITGTATHSGTTVLTGAVSGAGYSVGTLSNPYKFCVYRNSAFNATNAFAKVNFDTKVFDTSSNFDAVTNFRFTAPITGFYQLAWQVGMGISGTDNVAALYKNGSVFAWGTEGNGSASNGSVLVSAAANDYYEVFCVSSGTIAAGVGSAPMKTYFSGFLESAT